MDNREGLLSWNDVLRYHKTQAGIHAPIEGGADAQRSILTNTAHDAPYPDEEIAQGFYYIGEGQAGDQQPTRGNRGLINAEEHGYAIRVFEKVRTNVWSDRGYYAVVSHDYVQDAGGRRRLLRFHLRPIKG